MGRLPRLSIVVITFVVLTGGCSTMFSKGKGSKFETLEQERVDMEALVSDLASLLGVDAGRLTATQRECADPANDGKDRVDFNLVVSVDDAPGAATYGAVEQALHDRGWATERSSSATTEDIFANRGDADLTVTAFQHPTRVSISGSTSCHRP